MADLPFGCIGELKLINFIYENKKSCSSELYSGMVTHDLGLYAVTATLALLRIQLSKTFQEVCPQTPFYLTVLYDSNYNVIFLTCCTCCTFCRLLILWPLAKGLTQVHLHAEQLCPILLFMT